MDDGHVIIELPEDEYVKIFGPISPRVADYFAGKTITNADRIRAMTDDAELAKYLCKLIREGVMMAIPGIHYSSADIEELNQNWLDWLKQEVDDEN